ncbi:hypothetical protein OPQ81_006431 [Rhizoctonia solani]|nr:hypothetical protein OPQ81_006431 [Rhizoctonia solani]
MDAGIISAFKARYRRRLARLAIRRDNAGLLNAYQINQREAMELATAARDDVTPDTIANCWRHTGITAPEEHHPMEEPIIYPEPGNLVDGLAAELNLAPEHTHPAVYDMLATFEMDLPTEEGLSVGQIVQQMQNGIIH